MFEKLDNYPFVNIWNFELNLYNDFSKIMPDELKRLRSFLNKYCKNHSLSGNGSSYFVAYPGNFSSKIVFTLKKEFPNYKIYRATNSNGHKILTKYQKYGI